MKKIVSEGGVLFLYHGSDFFLLHFYRTPCKRGSPEKGVSHEEETSFEDSVFYFQMAATFKVAVILYFKPQIAAIFEVSDIKS
ncbi:MAG: hypothetical protein JXR48_03425 [Candidatus Delongbacteria bacterium]|nr:hypothetical protein [Candidatus Delongbacteria bacterium]